MEQHRIPIILFGHGGIGRHHYRLLRANPSVDLLGVVDPALPVLESRVVSHWKELGLVDPGEQTCVVLATPIATHYLLALEMLTVGFHVFVEKPLAWTVQEAQQLQALAKQKGKVLFVGHSEAFNPAFISFLEQYHAGVTGEVYRIECNRSGPYPQKPGDYGATIDLAVHDLEGLTHLLEKDEPEWFFGNAEQRIHPTQEDGLNAMIRFRSGVLATLTVNWLSPRKTRYFNVFGKLGMLQCDFYLRTVTFFENRYQRSRPDEYGIGGIEEGDVRSIPVGDWEPLAMEQKSFLQQVTSRVENGAALQRAVIAVDWAGKLLQSAKLNTPVWEIRNVH